MIAILTVLGKLEFYDEQVLAAVTAHAETGPPRTLSANHLSSYFQLPQPAPFWQD